MRYSESISRDFQRVLWFGLIALGTWTHLAAGSEVYLAQALRGDPQNTSIVRVQNADRSRAAVTIEFYGSSGQLEETRRLMLDPNGSGSVTLGEEQLSLRAGWVAIRSDRRITATAFYSFEVDGQPVPPIGVLPTEAARQWRSFIEIRPGERNTGLAVVNPDSERSSSCRLSVFEGPDARLRGSVDITLRPREQTGRFLTQLIGDLAGGFEGSALLECDRPAAALTLNQQRDGAVSTVAMDNTSGYTRLYFAQALRGDPLNTTTVFIQNADTSSSVVTAAFHASSGQVEETRQLTLEPNGTGTVTLGESDLPLRAGWVEVRSDGRVVATAFYSFQVGGTSAPRIGVLPTGASTEWRSFVEVEPGEFNTGLAIANPDAAQDALCSVTAYRGSSGQLAGRADIEVASSRQTARFLSQIITDLAAGFEGVALLECDHPVAPVVLNQRADGKASTVALENTAALTYACGALLEASANFLQQRLDPFTGLPYDQLRCGCRHQTEQGICQSSGVVPQLADADISVFAEAAGQVDDTVRWRFVDAVPEGAGPTLLYALEVQLQLSEQNRFGGLIWGANADITRYRELRIRYRTADPAHTFEFKLNSGRPGSTVEETVQLPGTAADGSWAELGFVVSEAFPGVDPSLLNYLVLSTSRDLAGDTPSLWVDHIAFLADSQRSSSCSVVLDCTDGDCYPDLAAYEPLTGAVNIANGLSALSLLAAVGLIDPALARTRVEAMLDSLGSMPTVGDNPSSGLEGAGWVQDWHSPVSLMPDPRNRIAGMTDQPQLYSALMVVERSWPELSEKAASLRERMDFSVLYESQNPGEGGCPGALHWAVDACSGVQAGVLEFYGNDSLLGAFLAVATGAAPPGFWSGCLAQRGCGLNGPEASPWYTTGEFCRNPEIPASETGGPFLQLAGLLYLDGARLGLSRLTLSESARNMLSAQSEFAVDASLSLWGWANASDPDACVYSTCELFTRAQVTPYVCAMGLELLPRRCGANLLEFHRRGADAPLETGTTQHIFGLRDAWNQETNRGRHAYLYLDTGWSVLGLLNGCRNQLVRRSFLEHPTAQAGYQLLSEEPTACSPPGAEDSTTGKH